VTIKNLGTSAQHTVARAEAASVIRQTLTDRQKIRPH
jgi:hypothetical protein